MSPSASQAIGLSTSKTTFEPAQYSTTGSEDRRSNERASFAQRLADLGHERRTIQQALTVDAPMLTRMLSVSGRIPASVTEAIGAAKGIGRDRWLDLAQRIEHPSARAVALAVMGHP